MEKSVKETYFFVNMIYLTKILWVTTYMQSKDLHFHLNIIQYGPI